ncbi:speckle-type POZ protein A-like [Trichogramma pretiosum]|uniref:speckle-type POZ protein A-like n=1 Tax=Trichogramma pretiosum TaxID=7493 RepID=UPI0006C9D073|nr:speckle-type POZ protein A-like [Trichogramma pretiosum]
MSNVKKFTTHSYVDTKDYNYLWVIEDFILIREKDRGYVNSTLFATDEMEFQLIFETRYYSSGKYSDYSTLHISSSSNLNKNLPCTYKISVMKDDASVFTKTDTYQITTKEGLEEIFAIPTLEMNKFISSTGTMVVHCELKVATGEEENSANYEGDDANEGLSPKHNFDWIFLEKELSDVTLKTADGKKIPAHRVVLASASSVFRTMFKREKGGNKSQSVDMVDVTYKTAVELLRYIYTGRVVKPGFPLAMDVLAAADKYQLEELKSECEQIIGSNLSAENALDVLRVADKHNAKYLSKKAAEFIKVLFRSVR